MRTNKDQIAVIAKMVDLLDTLTSGDFDNPTILSQQLRLPRTTVYRILKTLIDQGVLTDDYHPGPRLLNWVIRAHPELGLEQRSRPSLKRLVGEFRETVSVYRRIGASRVCVVRQEGLEDVRHSVSVGVPMPLHVGSAGRILLAWLAQAERQALITQSVNATHIIQSQPLPDWAEIQSQGWALTVGERDPILASVSVPLFVKEEVCAALSISGPKQRFTEDRVKHMIRSLKHEARIIAQVIGDFPCIS